MGWQQGIYDDDDDDNDDDKDDLRELGKMEYSRDLQMGQLLAWYLRDSAEKNKVC